MAHITGGGITDNLPRVLPEGTVAAVDLSSWKVPVLFDWLQKGGNVPHDDMLRTFNMGIGLIVVTSPDDAGAVLDDLAARGDRGARIIGEIARGDAPSVHYRS
jgi:phosphoribosylformylglycinamidine cyclo-ligase